MKWILLVLIYHQAMTATFDDKAACMAAREIVINANIQFNQKPTHKVFCVPSSSSQSAP